MAILASALQTYNSAAAHRQTPAKAARSSWDVSVSHGSVRLLTRWPIAGPRPTSCRCWQTTAAQQVWAAAALQPGDQYFAAADSQPIILFDGVCNLCNSGVNFMLGWDKEGAHRFAALQSDAGRQLLQRSGRRPDDISSIVLVERECSYVKAAAVLRIAERLRAPLPLVAAALGVFPHLFKDAVYDAVAGNRYLIFGRTQACRLSDQRFEERFISS